MDLGEADRNLPITPFPLVTNVLLEMPSEENKVSSFISVAARRDTNVGLLVLQSQERIIRVVEFGRVCLRVYPKVLPLT